MKKETKAPILEKFDWRKRQSGGPRKKPESFGFDGNPSKKSLKKTENFVEDTKKFKEEIRKPRR